MFCNVDSLADSSKTAKTVVPHEEHKVNMHKVKTEPSKEEVPEVKKVEQQTPTATSSASETSTADIKKDLRTEIKASEIPIDDEEELDGMDVFEKAIDQVRIYHFLIAVFDIHKPNLFLLGFL